jgi:hypothetical protein
MRPPDRFATCTNCGTEYCAARDCDPCCTHLLDKELPYATDSHLRQPVTDSGTGKVSVRVTDLPFCITCDKRVTAGDVLDLNHWGHEFSKEDLAALELLRKVWHPNYVPPLKEERGKLKLTPRSH